jgi:hypothetical protein
MMTEKNAYPAILGDIARTLKIKNHETDNNN